MPDKTSYQQLQPEERLAIASLRLQDVSIRAMARMLGRSPSTVSRELTRNSSPAGYASVPAEALSAARRSAGRRPAKLCLQSVCWRVVLTLLECVESSQNSTRQLDILYLPCSMDSPACVDGFFVYARAFRTELGPAAYCTDNRVSARYTSVVSRESTTLRIYLSVRYLRHRS